MKFAGTPLTAVILVLVLVSPEEAQRCSELAGKALYHVFVETADVLYAGTDSKVMIRIGGTKGHIDTGPYDAAPLFERGRNDTFTFHDRDVGVLKSVSVKSDLSGPAPDWYIHKISVCSTVMSYTQGYLDDWVETEDEWIALKHE